MKKYVKYEIMKDKVGCDYFTTLKEAKEYFDIEIEYCNEIRAGKTIDNDYKLFDVIEINKITNDAITVVEYVKIV